MMEQGAQRRPSLAAAARQRPLVIRCGAFGDIVLLTTLLRQLHARFGQPVDVVSSGPWTRPLLTGQPELGELILIRTRRMPYWASPDQQRLVAWLRRRGAGPTWYCDPEPGRELIRRGGIPDDHVCDSLHHPWVPGEHFVDRWIRLANLSPPAFEGLIPAPAPRVASAARLAISPAARGALEPWLARRGLTGRPFVVIQAGNKRTMRLPWSRRRARNVKYWPEERWAAVIRGLRVACPEHAILLLGVPAEYDLNAEVARAAGVAGVYNVADDVPVPILLPLLERATGMVSVDTGPAHAAAGLGCPTVALFAGNGNPSLYRPGGTDTPVEVLTGELEGRASILGITAEMVLQAWRRLVGARLVTRAIEPETLPEQQVSLFS